MTTDSPRARFSISFQSLGLIAARFIAALALSLWIGGMAFFGIMAAPVLFRPEKSGIARLPETATLAPQMVSAMLFRFGALTTICGVLLVICALLDGALSRNLKSWLWRAQLALSLLCVTLSLYLNSVLLPQTRRDQAEILPLIARASRGEVLSDAQTARRATFDAGHSAYQRLASLNLYLLLAVLLLLVARGVAVPKAVPKPASKL